MESITMTSQSPGCDCSTMARPAPVPSNSLTLTLMPLASSKGCSSAGSAWSHQISALRSCASAGEAAKQRNGGRAEARGAGNVSSGSASCSWSSISCVPGAFSAVAKKLNQFQT